MNTHDLSEFLGRCHRAQKYGWTIAHAEHYADRIAKIAGSVSSPDGVKNSLDHLIALAEKALRVQAGDAPAVAEPSQEAKAAAKPKKGKKKAAEAEPEVEAEPDPDLDIPIVLPIDD